MPAVNNNGTNSTSNTTSSSSFEAFNTTNGNAANANNTAQEEEPSFFDTTVCKGEVILCMLFQECESGYVPTQLAISTSDGKIAVTVSQPDPLRSSSSSSSGGVSQADLLALANLTTATAVLEVRLPPEAIKLSDRTIFDLGRVQPWVDKMPNSDFITVVSLTGEDLADDGLWLYASSEPILQLKPVFMAAFSAGLLMPRMKVCPRRVWCADSENLSLSLSLSHTHTLSLSLSLSLSYIPLLRPSVTPSLSLLRQFFDGRVISGVCPTDTLAPPPTDFFSAASETAGVTSVSQDGTPTTIAPTTASASTMELLHAVHVGRGRVQGATLRRGESGGGVRRSLLQAGSGSGGGSGSGNGGDSDGGASDVVVDSEMIRTIVLGKISGLISGHVMASGRAGVAYLTAAGTHAYSSTFDSATVTQISISSNFPLMLAVGVSMLLAVLLGVAGSFVVYFLALKVILNAKQVRAAFAKFKGLAKSIAAKARGQTETYAEVKQKKKTAAARSNQKPVIPHPYRLPEALKGFILKNVGNSLKHYLDLKAGSMFQEKKSVPLKTFTKSYQDWCMEKEVRERDVIENEKVLAQYGISMKKTNDSTTDVLKRLLFKTDQEKEEESKHSGQAKTADENSLELFVRQECNMTPHEADFVFVNRMRREYGRFCLREKLKPVPVTEGVMAEKFGVLEDRITTRALVPQEKKEDGKKLGTKDRLKAFAFKAFDKVKVHGGDAGLVLAQVFILVLPSMWLVILAVFVQTTHQSSLALDAHTLLSTRDMLTQPWLLMDHELLFPNKVIMLICASFYLVSFVELVLFHLFDPLAIEEPFSYRRASFKGRTWLCCACCRRKSEDGVNSNDSAGNRGGKGRKKSNKKGEPTAAPLLTKWRWLEQTFVFACICLFVMAACGYVILVLVWAMLGAILNPSIFLPYAAAAATMMVTQHNTTKHKTNTSQQHEKQELRNTSFFFNKAFATAKLNELKKLKEGLLGTLKKATGERFKTMLAGMLVWVWGVLCVFLLISHPHLISLQAVEPSQGWLEGWPLAGSLQAQRVLWTERIRRMSEACCLVLPWVEWRQRWASTLLRVLPSSAVTPKQYLTSQCSGEWTRHSWRCWLLLGERT